MRSLTFLALAALGLVSSAALPATAGTLLVPQQFPTIQAALNAAKPYDTVLVSAKPKGGVYSEAVTISTPNVVLQGRNNPVLDGTNLGVTTVAYPGATFTQTVYPTSIDIRASHVAVRGLTVQNVADSFGYGQPAGINVGYRVPNSQTLVSFSDIEISGVTITNAYNGITIMGYAGIDSYGSTLTGLKNYRLIGDTVTNCYEIAAEITGASNVLVSGCQFTNNGLTGLLVGSNSYGTPQTEGAVITGNLFKNNYDDGVDVQGNGLFVAANESALNGNSGIYVHSDIYNPAVSTPGSLNPLPSAVAANSVHDNYYYGVQVGGTVTVSANQISRNAGYGLYLNYADYSTVFLNQITGTTLVPGGLNNVPFGSGGNSENGTGIYADEYGNNFGYTYPTGSNSLSITGNQVTGNIGDGVYLAEVTGCKVSGNDASSNSGVGIHLSDYASPGDMPNTVTQNRAVHNTLFDARDDSNAAADLTYNGGTSYGDNYGYGPSINVWTKNLFGITDPVGLSK